MSACKYKDFNNKDMTVFFYHINLYYWEGSLYIEKETRLHWIHPIINGESMLKYYIYISVWYDGILHIQR